MTLWANQHLLFLAVAHPGRHGPGMSENHFPPIPVSRLRRRAAGRLPLAYSVLQATLLRTEGDRSVLAAAIGNRRQGKGLLADVRRLMLDVNLGPALWLTQAMAPHMRQAGGQVPSCTWPARPGDRADQRHGGVQREQGRFLST